jgi:hypothetical protein
MRPLSKYAVCGIACILFLSPVSVTTATELVWTFINPSFVGGSYFNASWLMASAQAQNRHVEKSPGYQRPDPMADFEYNLNRQLLSRLTTKILNEAFGEDPENPLEPGEYIIGDYIINVTTNGGITVEITDIITGDTTTVQIPYY